MAETRPQGYAHHLPAIYQRDPLLRAFLGPFEEVLGAFSDLLSDIDRFSGPDRADSDFLPWLAGWVALLLDQDWEEAKRRELIGEAVALYRRRGTVEGLRRYLEIYTGYTPEIREWHWPGGMQIGVASRIGGPDPGTPDLPVRIPEPVDPQHPSGDTYPTRITARTGTRRTHGYYAVAVVGQDWETRRLYYDTRGIRRVQRGTDAGQPYVELIKVDGVIERHSPARITRLSEVVESDYTLDLEVDKGDPVETKTYPYTGGTYLVDEITDQPYRFVVEVRMAPDRDSDDRLEKVRAIIDLEKPAHTLYHLRARPLVETFELKPMQIGIPEHCIIGETTFIG